VLPAPVLDFGSDPAYDERSTADGTPEAPEEEKDDVLEEAKDDAARSGSGRAMSISPLGSLGALSAQASPAPAQSNCTAQEQVSASHRSGVLGPCPRRPRRRRRNRIAPHRNRSRRHRLRLHRPLRRHRRHCSESRNENDGQGFSASLQRTSGASQRRLHVSTLAPILPPSGEQTAWQEKRQRRHGHPRSRRPRHRTSARAR
jgi:hypothetical protein